MEDSDIQAAKNILVRGLKQLGIDPNQLPSVRRKVTPVLRTGFPPQVTGGTALEISSVLVDEPSNPNKIRQLELFDSSLWSVSPVMILLTNLTKALFSQKRDR